MKKRFMAAALAATLALGLTLSFSPAAVDAAGRDATSSLSKNNSINYLAKQVNLFVDIHSSEKNINSSKSFKLSALDQQVDVACLAIIGSGVKDGVDTKDTIKNGSYYRIKDDAIKNMYKKLYGKTVDLSKVKMKGKDVTVKKNDKFYAPDGDWGEGDPVYTIKSVAQTGSSTYSVVMSNDYRDYSTGIKYYSQGTTTMTLKKKSSKYILKSISYSISRTETAYEKDIELYAPILRTLKTGQSYAFVDMSSSIDALLVTDYTYKYNSNTYAAINATVYGVASNGAVTRIGSVTSAGTAYPLTMGKTNHCLYSASGHSVEKDTLGSDNISLVTVESANEEFDTSGNATYYHNGVKVDNDTYLRSLYNEMAIGTVVNFIER